MGRAYADSGSRVVLVDADFIGRGLSQRTGCTDSQCGVIPFLQAAASSPDTPIDCETRATSHPGLHILPVGSAENVTIDEATISVAAMRTLLTVLKRRFDTILIDTGPVLGSHEASAAATVADELVLVVARGQSHSFVKLARERLQRLGVSSAHIVFNRAAWSDLARYPGSVSSRAYTSRGADAQMQSSDVFVATAVGLASGETVSSGR